MPENLPTIENEAQYEALRDERMDEEKADRVANTPEASKRGGSSPPYEQWSREELYQRAQELEIEGRSSMSKDELITALRG